MRIPILVQALILLLLFPASATPQDRRALMYWTMAPEQVDKLLRHDPQEDSVRLAQLYQTFSDLECRPPQLRKLAVPHRGANLLCALPGETPQTIVVAAHYQHVGPGDSAIEDWSGSIMLAFLYHALALQPRHHTFLFLAFDGEDGARAWEHSLGAHERRDMNFMVALDALGLGPLNFYLRPVDAHLSPQELTLISTFDLSTSESGLPASHPTPPQGWFHTDDTRQFRYHSVPSLLLHSVDRAHQKLPGSAEDSVTALDGDRYYQTYRLLCNFVAELDRVPFPPRPGDEPRSLPFP